MIFDEQALRRLVYEAARDAVRDALAEHQPQGSELGYLSAAEAAKYLGLNEATVRAWIKSGKVPAVKPGRTYMIKRADLDTALARATGGPAPAGTTDIREAALALLAKGRKHP